MKISWGCGLNPLDHSPIPYQAPERWWWWGWWWWWWWWFSWGVEQRPGWREHVKTIINHPPVITMFIGGTFTIPKWVVYHSFNHFICFLLFDVFYPAALGSVTCRSKYDTFLINITIYIYIIYIYIFFFFCCQFDGHFRHSKCAQWLRKGAQRQDRQARALKHALSVRKPRAIDGKQPMHNGDLIFISGWSLNGSWMIHEWFKYDGFMMIYEWIMMIYPWKMVIFQGKTAKSPLEDEEPAKSWGFFMVNLDVIKFFIETWR